MRWGETLRQLVRRPWNDRGTFIGVLIIGVLMNGMNVAGTPAYYQQILQSVFFCWPCLLT